jgi:hypothetical protein
LLLVVVSIGDFAVPVVLIFLRPPWYSGREAESQPDKSGFESWR